MSTSAVRFVSVILFSIIFMGTSSAQGKLFGGVSLPVGPFAGNDSAAGGFARTGYAIGVEYISKFYFDTEVGISGILCVNPFDLSALIESQPHISPGTKVSSNPWVLLWPTGSLGYRSRVGSDVSVYGKCQAGILYGVYPEITAVELGTKFTQNMAIDIAFAYGAGAGIILFNRYELSARIYFSKARYDVNVQGGGTSTNEKQIQQTANIAILAGIIL